MNSICRVCGGKAAHKGHLKQAKVYSTQFLSLFNYDLNGDQESIHPKNVCEKCRKKLDLVKKNPMMSTKNVLPNFVEHSKSGCNICLPSKKRSSKSLTLHGYAIGNLNIVSVAKELNFVDFSRWSSNENYEYVFGLPKVELSPFPTFPIHLLIASDYKWKLQVFGKDVEINSNAITKSFPNPMNSENCYATLNALKNMKTCSGNDDFIDLIKKKLYMSDDQGPFCFKDKHGQLKATVETEHMNTMNEINTIRVIDCELITDGKRCLKCQEYRKYLKFQSSRQSTCNSKFIPNKHLSKDQSIEKLQSQQKVIKNYRRSIDRYEKKIQSLLKEEGASLPDELNSKY